MNEWLMKRRGILKSPAFFLTAGLLLYGALFRDNDSPPLLPSGAFLIALALFMAVVLAAPGKRRLIAALYGAVGLGLLYCVYQTGHPYPALLVLGLLPLVYAAVRLKRRGRLTDEKAALLLLLSAMLLRVIYVLYTSVLLRQYDVTYNGSGIGHIGYIQYILENGFRFPALDMDPRTVYQFYHPPLHHYISAVFVKLRLLLGESMNNALEGLQSLMLFYSGVSLVAMYGLCREAGLKGRGLLTAFSLICFSPAFIMLSGSVNNDALMTMLALLALLNAVRWYKAPSMGRIVWIALALAGAALSKTSGLLIAPPIGFLFMMRFLKKGEKRAALLRQFGVFLAVCVPLSLSYVLFCHFKYGMPLTYVARLSDDSSLYVGNFSVFQRLFCFDRAQLENTYVIRTGDHIEYNIFLSLFKHSLFGEFTLTDADGGALRGASRLLLLTGFFLVGTLMVSLVRVSAVKIRRKGEALVPYLALQLCSVVLLGFFIKFCFDYPHFCTSNIRYVMLLIPVASITIGLDEKGTRWRAGVVFVYCFLSAAQFILLGL